MGNVMFLKGNDFIKKTINVSVFIMNKRPMAE